MEAIMKFNPRTHYGTSLLVLCAFAIVANILGAHAAPLVASGSHILTTAIATTTSGGISWGACGIAVGLVAGVLFAGMDGVTLGGGSFLAPLAIAGAIHVSGAICAS